MFKRCFRLSSARNRFNWPNLRSPMIESMEANGTTKPKANGKRAFNEGKRHFKKNKRQKITEDIFDGSNEQVLARNVSNLLSRLGLQEAKTEKENEDESGPALPEPFTEIELDVEELSSTGDGLGLIPGSQRVAIVPFTVPGDRVVVKVIRHERERPFTVTDFIRVIKGGPTRNDAGIECQYFARCSGCQFQMMNHQHQLDHKRGVVENAYKDFSGLPMSSLPDIGETLSSSMKYGYRTKLTPHFDAPANARKDRRAGKMPNWESVPPIGFMQKGTRKTMDIEDCPIGTDAVRKGLIRERKRVAKDIDTYRRGATLLCRESTLRKPKPIDAPDSDSKDSIETKLDSDAITVDNGDTIDIKTCITDQNAISTEYVGPYRFDNPAGSFFQNNNSILPIFITFIRSHILSRPTDPFTPTDSLAPSPTVPNPHGITHLVDAYSGSGLFTITLSPLFTHSIGIDVSSSSIASARSNAELNSIPATRANFLCGDATDIFGHVRDFPPDRTAVVLDPSRKGCDEGFLRQLLEFAPMRVCYVSCNVHTQARDVGVLCREEGGKYEVEVLRGFDFFPQTAHVESVAILRRREGCGPSNKDGAGKASGTSE